MTITNDVLDLTVQAPSAAPPQTWDFTVQGPTSQTWDLIVQGALLVTSGGHHWRPVSNLFPLGPPQFHRLCNYNVSVAYDNSHGFLQMQNKQTF